MKNKEAHLSTVVEMFWMNGYKIFNGSESDTRQD